MAIEQKQSTDFTNEYLNETQNALIKLLDIMRNTDRELMEDELRGIHMIKEIATEISSRFTTEHDNMETKDMRAPIIDLTGELPVEIFTPGSINLQ
jgi:hypothetical protein